MNPLLCPVPTRQLIGVPTIAALIAFSGGCATTRLSTHFDVAEYATTHRAVPEDILRRAGLPARYEKMPFICGTPAAAAQEEFKRSIAAQPEEERDRLLGEFAKVLASVPGPDPEYVVDLTKVDDMRIAWWNGRRVVALRHPVLTKEIASVWHHQPPSTRIGCRGPYLSGAGPVTIWRDSELLYFTDEPWMLINTWPDAHPVLLCIADHYRAGGPLEIRAFTAPGKRGGVGETCYFFLDHEITGGLFEVAPEDRTSGAARAISVKRLLHGVERPYGSLRFDRRADACFVPAEPTQSHN